ncbi:ferredoxin [bacterium BMS3Abin14]|nr:ferredoxin [bacterium BMS3Abin14]
MTLFAFCRAKSHEWTFCDPIIIDEDEKEVNTLAYVISNECTACGSCVDECPVEAISEGDIYVIDPELCTDCGACEAVCPVEAISPGD